MIDFVSFFVIIVLIIIIYMYFESNSYDVAYVKSKVDNQSYLVRNLDDKHEAADLLAKIKIKLVKLINFTNKLNNETVKDYLRNGDHSNEILNGFKRLKTKFQPNNISESTPNDKYTSYSVNKGEKIVFCLRARNKEESLVKENIMIFVAIHELAHIMTKSVGHTDEFWNNFRILLRIAIKEKLYQNIDFQNNPEDYCGTKITDSPLHP